MIPWYLYVVAALGLALLMVIHEGGHFLVARAFGMRVLRFSIGFGPTFCKIVPKDGYFWFTMAADRVRIRLGKHDPKRHGPTIYQIAAIPFLAFVQIAGMNPLEEIEPNDKGSYANASVLGRILTIFAGPLANYLFASVLFFGSFYIGGHIVPSTTMEVNVVPERPAAVAQMKSGDRVLEVNGQKVSEWGKMAEIISAHPGVTIPVVVERKGERVELSVTPANESGKGKIGISLLTRRVPITTKEAAQLALRSPAIVVRESVIGIGQYISGKSGGELSGPVGIVKETAKAAKAGVDQLLELLGVLSAYFGAINLVPFPGLDGARLMFLGYEATTRRRPNARIEAHIHLIGLAVMVGLMFYVTFHNDLGSKDRPAPAPAAPTSAAPASSSGK